MGLRLRRRQDSGEREGGGGGGGGERSEEERRHRDLGGSEANFGIQKIGLDKNFESVAGCFEAE